MKHNRIVIIFLLCIQSLYVFSWGADGHKDIGAVAYQYLNVKTKDSLQFYLGSVTLADAGLWMDQMRKNHDYDYMKPWHYININKGQSYKPDTGQNVINEIKKRIDRLKHRNLYSKEQVAVDLKILIHLVEDLHQPLHTGYASDTCANAVHITFMGKPTSLHWAWDNDIMLQQKIDVNACLALLSGFSEAQLAEKRKTDVLLWMNESHSLLPNVYDFKGKEIGEDYAIKNAPIIKLRLSLAGLRLSELLNDLFKS